MMLAAVAYKMKSSTFSFFLVGLAVFVAAGQAFAQTSTFSDPNVDYSFDLPDARWKMVVKPSATSPNVQYVFGDRTEGLLEVRKLTVAKDAILSDVVRNEETGQQFRPGYVAGREENFTGRLRGSIFNFEFVTNGRNMGGRFYFLQANPTTIYLLRFSGQKDTLRSIRGQTDSIARTFSLNK
jgi:hypothetical protein